MLPEAKTAWQVIIIVNSENLISRRRKLIAMTSAACVTGIQAGIIIKIKIALKLLSREKWRMVDAANGGRRRHINEEITVRREMGAIKRSRALIISPDRKQMAQGGAATIEVALRYLKQFA